MQFHITTPSELAAVAEAVITRASQIEGEAAVVCALSGDLGAGKTTLTQTLAQNLGVSGAVTSPTFVIMKRYDTQHQTFGSLVHIDAYRIETVDEMRPLQFSALLEEKGTIMCIEWAENIAELLPPETIWIRFQIEDAGRTITIDER